MGWGPARRRAAVVDLAERRLAGVARQWRCPPGPPDADEGHAVESPSKAAASVRDGWDALADEPAPVGRWGPPRWSRSAVRGLAVLLLAAVGVAAYWAWTGQPRTVTTAPSVLAVGSLLPGASSSGAPVEATASPVSVASPASGASPVSGASTPAASPAAVASTPVAPAVAMPQVVVHVTGLVARPGLVRLPQGARVADAVAEAGGVTRRRAADSVNLARVLVDGEQVVVGGPVGASGLPRSSPAGSGVPAGTPMGLAPGSVDLNTADASTLEELPGVGPVLAARIVAWRLANGAFRSVEELGEVSGIGDAVLSQVRDLVRV